MYGAFPVLGAANDVHCAAACWHRHRPTTQRRSLVLVIDEAGFRVARVVDRPRQRLQRFVGKFSGQPEEPVGDSVAVLDGTRSVRFISHEHLRARKADEGLDLLIAELRVELLDAPTVDGRADVGYATALRLPECLRVQRHKLRLEPLVRKSKRGLIREQAAF